MRSGGLSMLMEDPGAREWDMEELIGLIGGVNPGASGDYSGLF